MNHTVIFYFHLINFRASVEVNIVLTSAKRAKANEQKQKASQMKFSVEVLKSIRPIPQISKTPLKHCFALTTT